jgi:hypothetical protein
MDKTLISGLFDIFTRREIHATQNRGEKYNIYLTNSGQNTTFWTFFETMWVLAVLMGRQDSKNRKIYLFIYFVWTIK